MLGVCYRASLDASYMIFARAARFDCFHLMIFVLLCRSLVCNFVNVCYVWHEGDHCNGMCSFLKRFFIYWKISGSAQVFSFARVRIVGLYEEQLNKQHGARLILSPVTRNVSCSSPQ